MSSAFPIALDLVVRTTLLLGAGALVGLMLRRQSASVRHLAWSASLGGALTLGVLVPWAPRLDIPLRSVGGETLMAWSPQGVVAAPGRGNSGVTVPIDAAEVRDRVGSTPTTNGATRAGTRVSPWLAAWMTGAALVLAWGVLGRLGLARLARRATLVTEGPWRASVDQAATALRVRRPIRILRSSMVGAPVTWGVRRPVLVVPAESDAWTNDVRRSVAAHEVAHIARQDYLHQVIGLVACAVYWFHPLAWAVGKRMRQSAEQACDDLVLAHGTSGEDYAAHLIGVARGSRSLRLAGAVAIGMARPSTLEGRIVAVLDEGRRRGEPSPRGRSVIAIAAVGALFVFGALRPVSAAARIPTTVAGPSVVTSEALPPVIVPAPRTEPVALGVGRPAIETQDRRQQSWEKDVPASPGGLLQLDLKPGGDVIIRGWDENRVVVRTRLAGEDWRDVEVKVERQSNGVLVESRYTGGRNTHSSRNEFEIRVPRRYDVRISSSGGTLTMVDVQGSFSGHTGGGGFVLERLTGSASLSTGGGEIRVADSDLSGRVRTGGGLVMLSRVSGGLRGSSGSGPVIQGESDVRDGATADLSSVDVSRDGASIRIGSGTSYRAGTLSIEKAGGSIDLEAAPNGARVRTGGGDVRVGRSSGDVRASTGGGDVTVGPASGSVRAGTGAGEVHVVVDRSTADQVIEASSGQGRVIIELPRDWQGRLDLETAHTRTHEETARIRSDWEVDEEPLTDWDDREGTPRRYLRATARIGRGDARVIVRTVNGEIEIRRR